jgi:hypothetical protein
MRKVVVTKTVRKKIKSLRAYLLFELNLSKDAAHKRIDRMKIFLQSLSCEVANYPLCRFKKWRNLGYRCVVFEKKLDFCLRSF